MEIKLTLLALPLLYLLGLLLTHALAVRAWPKVSGQKLVLLVILSGNFPSLGLGIFLLWPLRLEGWLPVLAYLVVVYNGLGYGYFHFFNLSETARRIRLLIEVYQGVGAGTEKYQPESMVKNRIDRLVAMGQLEEGQGKYRVKGRLLLNAALVLELYKKLLGF
ncbi:MAG: hypothetical protein A2600_12455 [Candidatus Lambdaproteobacteria bacterium RIFOXYD1_FULL_56_27]|uniref:Uncharacterized protein n=1 Tax=Candidatus Lambdaproteobacteria bacterium RIFOXYD2_FULL_56_26 TaxID=1817773 RepID=A0A1F6GT64_9PROT|nr:MAG: hypothetical protein A2426_00060 [Candidatus Lambdaproteobacteria bacterium RIFOXYC1_FULL_56_13]OGH01181.1 MAG: hypothetical protein A2557_01550 [Candidatus Lambdaproteobacteria bacterium RIFOXYD2_FULL_56_26]OGH06451.1 MAG: hypothetical protein A2600_12455 [Candidatus Lambdaproteobacteria bacterium RIFOXYD1_FULL_56_27]